MFKAIKRRFSKSRSRVDISNASSRESVVQSGQEESSKQINELPKKILESGQSLTGLEDQNWQSQKKTLDLTGATNLASQPLALDSSGETRPLAPTISPPGLHPQPLTTSTTLHHHQSFHSIQFHSSPTGKPTPTISKSKLSSSFSSLHSSKDRPHPLALLEIKRELPKYQLPVITLLKKAREGQLPKGACYTFEEERQEANDKPVFAIKNNKTELAGNQRVISMPLIPLTSHFYGPSLVPSQNRKNNTLPLTHYEKIMRSGKISEYNPNYSFTTYWKKYSAPKEKWDKGYESDSTTIIKKERYKVLSPKEQRKLYTDIQNGLDIPLRGLYKNITTNENIFTDINAETQSSNKMAGKTKVDLLQERIETKLKRSHSDIISTGHKDSASRLIRNVRNSNKSHIPLRLVKQSELKSPKEVGKIIKSEILSIKVETISEPTSTKKKKTPVKNQPAKKVKIKSVSNNIEKSVKTPIKPPRVKKSEAVRQSEALSMSRTSTPSTTTTASALTVKQRSPTPVKDVKDKPKEKKTVKETKDKQLKDKQDKLKYQAKPTKTSILREMHCSQPTLTRSLSSLNYNNYIQNIKSPHGKKSPHFTQLHRLYSSLDRLNKLNNSKDYYSLTKLPSSKKYDFDTWFKYRNRSRVDQEAELLEKELLKAQNNKEFYFRPKEIRNWSIDSGLRIKKFSVDEIKRFLLRDKEIDKDFKDIYRLNYRGMTVKESALNLEVNELYLKKYGKVKENFDQRPLRRAFSMSSTLTDEQRNSIKNRIKCFIENRDKDGSGRGSSRNVERLVTRPMGFTYSSDPYKIERPLSSLSVDESFRKEMSYKLSEELKCRNMSELLRNSVRKQYKDYRPYYTFYRTVIDKSFYEGRPVSPVRSAPVIDKRSPSPVRTNKVVNRSPSPLVKFIRNRSPSPVNAKRAVSPNSKMISKLADLLLQNKYSSPRGSVEKLTDYFESYEVVSKSSPDITTAKRSASAAEILSASRDKYLTTRSRKPIYQPSSSPNVCQATLLSQSYLQKNSMEDLYSEPSLYEKKVLDDRLNFDNYDADLHKPKYRYVPEFTSLPVVHTASAGIRYQQQYRQLRGSSNVNNMPVAYKQLDQQQNKQQPKFYFYHHQQTSV